MTSYFDEMTTRVCEASEAAGSNDKRFIEELASIEQEVARDVSLCVGDREFPDTWRDKALGILATKSVAKLSGLEPTQHAVEFAATVRDSELLVALHSLFHRVAVERIKTRFGFLSDDPRGNWKRRDAHAEEHNR